MRKDLVNLDDQLELVQKITSQALAVYPNLGLGKWFRHGMGRSAVMAAAFKVVNNVLDHMVKNGIRFEDIEPGHGLGHMARDYINAAIIFSELQAKPEDVFLGIIAGVLHDVGCAVVPRYEESATPIRHAEAGALLLQRTFMEMGSSLELTDDEQAVVLYAVLAHTHYLKPQEIIVDGNPYVINPYPDSIPFLCVIWPVWFARWVDRGDNNGAFFPTRHFLTTWKIHADYNGSDHYQVEFVNHLRPLLRSKEERGSDPQTMLEHLEMFRASQNNTSPFGVVDYGSMVEFRDRQSERLGRIIRAGLNAATDTPRRVGRMPRVRVTKWLHRVEPTTLGRFVADTLMKRIKSEQAWVLAMFEQSEIEARAWAKEAQEVFERHNINTNNILPIGEMLHW